MNPLINCLIIDISLIVITILFNFLYFYFSINSHKKPTLLKLVSRNNKESTLTCCFTI